MTDSPSLPADLGDEDIYRGDASGVSVIVEDHSVAGKTYRAMARSDEDDVDEVVLQVDAADGEDDEDGNAVLLVSWSSAQSTDFADVMVFDVEEDPGIDGVEPYTIVRGHLVLVRDVTR